MPFLITVKCVIFKGFFTTRVYCLYAAAAILYVSEKIMGGTLYITRRIQLKWVLSVVFHKDRR